MAILSNRDAAVWHLLGERAALPIATSLDGGVLANLDLATERWAVGRALGVANQRARRMAERWPLLLRTDVASFYGSVTPSVLAAAMHGRGADHADATKAADMLEGWGSEGYPGLPIGPPASGVMANAILGAADEALSPMPFLRWVDDYLVGLGSERAVDEAIDRVDAALERLGLERSEHKTMVLEGGGPWPGGVFLRGRSC